MHRFRPDRRALLGTLTAGAAFFTTRGLFAELVALAPTPPREEGPFYPDRLPLDTDNDLIIVNDHLTPAVGEITHLTGRVLDASGSPVRGATVEIWQCDANAVYLHTADSGGRGADQRDRNFQGFGRFVTDSTGGYRFRTIKPVPYPGRPAPHIHFKIKKGDRELLTTQMNIAGHPGNNIDPIAVGGLSLFERELLQVDFKPVPGSKLGELAAHFEIVLGRTPDEQSFRPKATATRPLA
jgi:protocatechuate 3,4-dioxygenase beta subunit